MRRLVSAARRHVRRARDAERFVGLIVGGGIGLVAGLWTAALAAPRSAPWFAGVALSLAGAGGLAAGIRRGIA